MACQPFGPDDHISFTALGYHDRGFPAFGICCQCEKRIQAGQTVALRYRGVVYTLQKQ